jgi:hypothetical protein
MTVKFKDNVSGFVYDSEYGEVKAIFGKVLTESEKNVIQEVLGEYDCLFTDIKLVNELFTFEDEDSLNCDSEGLNKVLDWIK